MSNEKARKTVSLGVTVNSLESREAIKLRRAVAYAFSSGGHLLARKSLYDMMYYFRLVAPIAIGIACIMCPARDSHAESCQRTVNGGFNIQQENGSEVIFDPIKQVGERFCGKGHYDNVRVP